MKQEAAEEKTSLPVTEIAQPKKEGILYSIKKLAYKLKKEYLWMKNLNRLSSSAMDYVRQNKLEIASICAIEMDSLFVTTKLNQTLHKKLVFSSMELSFWDVIKPKAIRNFLNSWVKNVLKQVDLITIQDEDRKNVFLKHTQATNPFTFLPVGILGPANTIKSDFLREKFNIPQHQKIVLYAGSIRSWASVLEIVADAIHWSDDKCLVINGWIGDVTYFQDIQKLALGSKNIHISTEPVPWEQLDSLIASADIALAIYRDADDNKLAIASSSNKLCIYAKSGVPVIINRTPSTIKLFNETCWGVGIEAMADLEQAVNTINKDLDSYKRNAFLAFDKYYNLSTLSEDFIKELV